VDVPVESLRAWERRYGLLRPERTGGGFRLYSEADVDRVRAMRANLERGLSAAEAARLVLDQDGERAANGAAPALQGAVLELDEALRRFDDTGAQAVLDRLLATLTLDVVLRDVLVPYLRELGERWTRGEGSIAEEHFASSLIRGRLLALARGWDRGVGPRALLACAATELHDLPLVMLGLALRSHGWRISYLGADTPSSSLVDTAASLGPDAVVVSGSVPRVFEGQIESLRGLAEIAPLHVAGGGASADLAEAVGGTYLAGDPVSAAAALAAAPHRA
jgi:DNA-binding transcriptional MerR regulator/methylmalonyl-CoA mutase cobalamin-binding subunit